MHAYIYIYIYIYITQFKMLYDTLFTFLNRIYTGGGLIRPSDFFFEIFILIHQNEKSTKKMARSPNCRRCFDESRNSKKNQEIFFSDDP